MKDPKIPSFRAIGHSTYKIDLSIVAFKLMTIYKRVKLHNIFDNGFPFPALGDKLQ